MKSKFAPAVAVIFALFFGLLCARSGIAGFESGGGAAPIPPLSPEPRFKLDCQVTWLAEGASNKISSAKASVSRGHFVLDNDQTYVDLTSLQWVHGYAETLDVNLEKISGHGNGEALRQFAQPDSASLSFEWAPHLQPNSAQKLSSYLASLELNYFLPRNKKDKIRLSIATTRALSEREWTIEGRAVMPQSGASTAHSVFGLRCVRQK